MSAVADSLEAVQANSQFIKILPPLVNGFAANILAYATLLAAVSTIVMALLELAKGVFGLRLVYQRSMLKKWTAKQGKAYNQLVVLSVSDLKYDKALFNQPSDKMMGEIQAAANIALDFPNLYPEAFLFLTATSFDPNTSAPSADAAIWQAYNVKPPVAGTPTVQDATQARARLDHFVTRKLDAFQTRIDYVWARINQVVSITGSSVFIYILLQHIPHMGCGEAILPAIFGGMIAPFAKDVVTAISGLKAGK